MNINIQQLIEQGEGLQNVFKYSKAYSGSEKVIFLEEDIFIVKVPLVSDVTDKVTDNVTDKVTDKVTDNQKRMIENIIQNNRISTKELAIKVGISTRKIKENIHKLKDLGILNRIGPTKGGYWEIIKTIF